MLERLRRDEGGFTLIELLIASMIGTLIILAAFGLMDAATRGQRTTENRLDATTQARNAMEQITRQLRSAVCFGKGTAPTISAEANRIVFYSSVAPTPTTASATQTVQKRTVEYVAGGNGRGRIVETVVNGNTQAPPDTQFTGAPRVRTIVDNVEPTLAGGALFRYFRYDPATATSPTPVMQELTPPLTGANADLQLLVQVETGFRAYPVVNKADEAQVSVSLDNRITVRTADPTDPTHSPKCI